MHESSGLPTACPIACPPTFLPARPPACPPLPTLPPALLPASPLVFRGAFVDVGDWIQDPYNIGLSGLDPGCSYWVFTWIHWIQATPRSTS